MSFKLPKNSKLLESDFVYGVATASFQIEGAGKEDGRCESIWDRFCATEGKVLNGDNGDVACDHYHRLEEDLDLIKSLGVDVYRFSIAWPRIEPKPGEWNEAGFAFYEKLVDGLISRGIKPYATMYHWDLPQYLEDKGGWVNRETAYSFARYTDKVTARLGDKVHAYSTFNEPWCSAFLGYRWGIHAPGIVDDRLGFQACHHLLLAHGLGVEKIRQNAPKAQCGIVLNFTPNYPYSNSSADAAAADFADEENSYWFIQPLLEGSYPHLVCQTHPDWIPIMVEGDMEIISRPIDYLGVNFYTRQVVQAKMGKDYDSVQPTENITDIGWEIYPEAFSKLLVDLNNRYSNLPPIVITENGIADNTEKNAKGDVVDTMRMDYFQSHLMSIHNAIEAGVDIRGYIAWSLMDNFEWAEGYSMRFGIVHVNYQTQERTLKESGKMWKTFLTNR